MLCKRIKYTKLAVNEHKQTYLHTRFWRQLLHLLKKEKIKLRKSRKI